MARIHPEKILKFEELLHSFALVERVAHIKGRDYRENDVEHSYFLPMLAWYVIDAFTLPLDATRAIRYALVHDLVEVYAGDTYIFDEEARKTKYVREKAAQKRLASEFPEFPSVHEYIEAYESQADAESRFVKALDKIEPFLANYLQEGRTWKEMNVSYEEIITNKREKLSHHPELLALLEELIALVEPKKAEYFNQ